MLHSLTQARQTRRLAVLATRLPDGAQVLLLDRDGRLAPEPMLATELGPIVEAANAAVASGRSRTSEIDGRQWFFNLQTPPPRLLVVGAVHIAQVLAPLARLVGLQVVVIDPRAGFATADRFPDTELLLRWPDEALHELAVDRHSAVVTLTHDQKLDDPALDAALASQAFYVGALGSRKTQAARRDRLREQGHGEAALTRIRGPIGLPLGAVGAEEIALSIVAELVAVRRGAALAGRVP